MTAESDQRWNCFSRTKPASHSRWSIPAPVGAASLESDRVSPKCNHAPAPIPNTRITTDRKMARLGTEDRSSAGLRKIPFAIVTVSLIPKGPFDLLLDRL